MAKPKKFIQKVLSKKGSKGALHRALHVPEGEKIPEGEIEEASHAKGHLGQMARFAKVLHGLAPHHPLGHKK